MKIPHFLSYTALLFFIATSVNISSCKSNRVNPNPSQDLVPEITSLAPFYGPPGTVITISGNRFGSDKTKVKVRFKTKDVDDIISLSDNKLEVAVPPGFDNGPVDVTVYVGDLSSNSKVFQYINETAPIITSVTATCFYNSTVIITGSDFSNSKEDNEVLFGDQKATVVSATKTSLVVLTPDLGAAESVKITVTRSGMISNAKSIVIDQDQNKIATYSWTTNDVRTGVTYKTGQFSVFGALQRIHILDVSLNETNTLGIGVSSPNKNTVAICNSYDAVVGINAGYFPLGESTPKDPYIRIDGVKIQDGDLGVSQIFTNAALLIHNNIATVRKFTNSGTNLNSVASAIPVSEAENIIVCGPMLVTSNVIENLDMNSSHNKSITARTGLGVTADGKRLFMVVVDYNTTGATGVTTLQLAKILQALGAVNAMNFDGGGSSTMFVKDKGDNGRVSTNGNSQRAVRSVIYVK